MRNRSAGVVLFILVALGGFGATIWLNAEEAQPIAFSVPTQAPPTDNPEAWQALLRQGFGSNSTPLPTVPIPTQPFAIPTLPSPVGDVNVIPIAPATAIAGTQPVQAEPGVVTPTQIPNSPTPLGQADDEVPVSFTQLAVTNEPDVWQPPPLIPPLSRDPLGRDHYWFIRPVDSNATNFGLFYYPYGSDGPEQENPWRVHHGIDMPNNIGETVRAAGAGSVIWAADTLRVEDTGAFQNSPSYGNVVVVQHDFGYRGQTLYTLYAHLSAVLVERGQFVNSGDVVGLVGNTGRVSGAHVHFEVRMGENAYRATYNPVLWMVPYVGHGVVAGRVLDEFDNEVQDADITLRNWVTGLTEDTSSTYVYLDNGSDVNPDPIWQENFVFGDVPVGRYEVITTVNGRRLSKIIDVLEGTTNFVELKAEVPATPIPSGTDDATDVP